MVNVYIERVKNSGEYFLLNLNSYESINMMFKAKDSSDISKTLSTFSHTFVIPADSNNLSILKFVFDKNIVISRDENIKAKIYIGSDLFKEGYINITSCTIEQGEPTTFEMYFFTSLTSIKEIVGDDLLSIIGGAHSYVDLKGITHNVPVSDFTMVWSDTEVIKALTASQNGYMIPLISTERVFNIDVTNTTDPNNIYAATGSTNVFPQAIIRRELRPAISFDKIFDRIQEYYGLQFDFSKTAVNIDLDKHYVHLTRESADFNISDLLATTVPFTIKVWSLNPDGLPPPTGYNIYTGPENYTFNVTIGDRSAIRQSFLQVYVNVTNNPDPGTMNFYFENLKGDIVHSVEEVVPTASGGWLQYYGYIDTTAYPSNSTTSFRIRVTTSNNTGLGLRVGDPNPSLNGITYRYVMVPQDTSGPVNYQLQSEGNLGVDEFNQSHYTGILKPFFNYLPDMKVIDFINSYIKMYNLRIEEKGQRSLSFYSTVDLFSSVYGVKDYSNYIDRPTQSGKKIDRFKNYIFSYVKSTSYRNVAYASVMVNNPNSKEFGQLLAINLNNNNPADYKVENNFNLGMPVKVNQTRVITYNPFATGDPEKVTTPAYYKYKMNTKDFSIFLHPKVASPVCSELINVSGDYTTLQLAYRRAEGGTTIKFSTYNRVNIDDSVGSVEVGVDDALDSQAISYKDEVNVLSGEPYVNNLYQQYYNHYLLGILDNRTNIYSVSLKLPIHEMLAFNMKNKIVIGNDKYIPEEVQMDLVTGNTKMKLQNLL